MTAAIWIFAAVVGLESPATAGAADGGTIFGHVYGEGVRGGVERAEVCVEEPQQSVQRCEFSYIEGFFAMSELPPGGYFVEFRPPVQQNLVSQFYPEKQTRREAEPLTIGEGQSIDITAGLERGARINGRVTASASGQPVPDVVVCAYGVAVESSDCEETDVDGTYSVFHLRGGQYEVEFFPEESDQNVLETSYAQGLVTVPSKGEVNGVDQALPAGGQIMGTIREAATGTPLAGIRVCLTEAESLEEIGCLSTSASGRYSFSALWNGVFKIAVSPEAEEFPYRGPPDRGYPDAYPTQWWKGADSFEEATPILITPPAIASGIDAASVLPLRSTCLPLSLSPR